MNPDKEKTGAKDLNRDLLTGEVCSHPLGTGIGATGGVATGAAIGAMGGPVGMVIGGAIGAVAGGLAGKGVAEAIDPTAEDEYWNENYGNISYRDEGETYEDYKPAHKPPYGAYSGIAGRTFEDSQTREG